MAIPKYMDELITELEAQAQADERTGRSVNDRHWMRQSTRDRLVLAIEKEIWGISPEDK